MKTNIKILTAVTLAIFMLGAGTASAQYYRPRVNASVVIQAEFGRPHLAIQAVIPACPQVVVVNPGYEEVYYRHDNGKHKGWYNPRNPHYAYTQPYGYRNEGYYQNDGYYRGDDYKYKGYKKNKGHKGDYDYDDEYR